MIATDLETITTIQGFGFSIRKPGSFQVYSDEFSRKERPTIEEYDITHDERTDEKI